MDTFKRFDFDVLNLKKDFEVEQMNVTQNDIDVLRQYADKKITIDQIVDRFRQTDKNETKIQL